jgi:hypothetical protein
MPSVELPGAAVVVLPLLLMVTDGQSFSQDFSGMRHTGSGSVTSARCTPACRSTSHSCSPSHIAAALHGVPDAEVARVSRRTSKS